MAMRYVCDNNVSREGTSQASLLCELDLPINLCVLPSLRLFVAQFGTCSIRLTLHADRGIATAKAGNARHCPEDQASRC